MDEAAVRGPARCTPSARRAPARRGLPIRADDRLATRDAWLARIPTSVRARIRGGPSGWPPLPSCRTGRPGWRRRAVSSKPSPSKRFGAGRGSRASNTGGPAAGGARTDSNHLSGVGSTPPRERRLADAHPRVGPHGGDRAAEPRASPRRGGATPRTTKGPSRSADGGPRGWRACHGPSRSPTGTSRAATPRSRARSAQAMGSATAIAIAGRCCWASAHRSRSHRV